MSAPLWLVERGCTRKRWYRTAAEARQGKAQAERCQAKKFRIYRCPWCGGWHLTTKKGGEGA